MASENRLGPVSFGGEPGELVPQVDPDDVQAVWQQGRELLTRYPNRKLAVGLSTLQAVCKPGVNVEAVSYRASLLWLLARVAPDLVARFTWEGQPDYAVFRAIARVSAQWIGVGIVRQELPFDVNEFVQLCEAQTEGPQHH